MLMNDADKHPADRIVPICPSASTADVKIQNVDGERRSSRDADMTEAAMISAKDVAKSKVVKFGSAENGIAEEVAADIAECDRINGADDFFGSVESRIREKLKPAYKTFRRATSDPAYRAELVSQLITASGGTYAPSAKKPMCLAAFVALKPKTDAHAKQTYDAAYYFAHAAIEDISLDAFSAWIEGRNLKASIALVRSRKNAGREPKAKSYPNLAKARTLKKNAEVAKILNEAKDLAETELAALFVSRDGIAANA